MLLLLRGLVKLFTLGFAIGSGCAVGLGLYAISLIPELPTVEEIRHVPLNIPLRIYTSDNQLIGQYGNERRIPLDLDDAPPLLIDALLATEDENFYHHTGVDFKGIARAVLSNLVSGSRGQGASTITMQVARNFFLNPEKTYTRKLKEIMIAFMMERKLTKDEILELYLNKIFLGHRSYGFAAAAEVYYGDAVQNLSLPELAMVAGLPKAPSYGNPISNPKRAKKRRNYVLARLHELGRIDQLSFETASEAPITARSHAADVDLDAPFAAEMARQYMLKHFGEEAYGRGFNVTMTINGKQQLLAHKMLRKGLLDYDKRHGYRGILDHLNLASIDLDDPTQKELLLEQLDEYAVSHELLPALVTQVNKKSINILTQEDTSSSITLEDMTWARQYKSANSLGKEITSPSQVVKQGDIIYVEKLAEERYLFSQMPNVSGALVSLDPKDGSILAINGGFDYYLSKFNRAVQAERQPGSNIKPFIYSAALDNGFTPSTLVSAAPIVVQDDLEGVWKPQNYSKKVRGPTRLREALGLSLNLVSVRLMRAVGIDKTIEHLKKFGLPAEKLPRQLSLSLGGTTLTPLEVVSAYAVIANGGKSIEPTFIKSIVDSEGKNISIPAPDSAENTAPDATEQTAGETSNAVNTETTVQAGQQMISPQNAFLTRSIMQEVIVAGTGRRALRIGRKDLAGKTGTTNDYKDAWFSGFNPDVVTTVYVGFDKPAHLGRRESGASAALPIWVDYMEAVLKDYPERPLEAPQNIVTRHVDRQSGESTSKSAANAYLEYFLAGTEPGPSDNISHSSGTSSNSSGSSTSTMNESLF